MSTIADMISNNGTTAPTSNTTTNQPETNDEAPYPDWSSLPSVALIRIYAHLRDNDRNRMSIVCRSWSRVFHNPRLWRQRRFRFGGFRANRNTSKRALGFARAAGKHLKCLYLLCECPSYWLCKRFQKTMNTFLKTLTWRRAQLKELFIPQLQTERFWRHEFFRKRLVSSFVMFLRHQEKLETFDLAEAAIRTCSALRILDAVTRHNGKNLRIINIEDFFHTRQPVCHNIRYQSLMFRLTTLQSVYLNYTYVSDTIILGLAQNCGKTLKYISIKVYRMPRGFHEIDTYTWEQVKRAAPALRISVYFEGVGDYPTIKRCLSRGMPLSILYLWTGMRPLGFAHNWQLFETLRYIANSFACTLEEASLAIETGEEAVDESLLHMILRCKHLEALDLQAQILVPTVATICQLQEEKKINLQKCHISAEKLTGIEVQELEGVKQRYEPVLEERGVDFRIMVGM